MVNSYLLMVKGISKNSLYPSLLEKGDGLRRLKARFLEMPLMVTIIVVAIAFFAINH